MKRNTATGIPAHRLPSQSNKKKDILTRGAKVAFNMVTHSGSGVTAQLPPWGATGASLVTYRCTSVSALRRASLSAPRGHGTEHTMTGGPAGTSRRLN